jgi:radical SAM protein with 4Fe4S-binding SPASM domain
MFPPYFKDMQCEMEKTGKLNHSYVIKKDIDRTLIWEGSTRPLLSELVIELTERCNNNCIHCYINRPADDPVALREEIHTETVKAIIEEAAALGCIKIRFTGGEPLLREDFDDIYVFTRRLGCKVEIFTNATLIDENRISLFSEIPPLEPIEVTLYGMTAKSYEAVSRTPGSFENAWRAINLLRGAGIPVTLRGVNLPPNRAELEEMTHWADDVHGERVSLGLIQKLDLRGRRDSSKKNDRIRNLRLSPGKVVKRWEKDPGRYRNEIAQFCRKFAGAPGEKLFNCGAGIGSGCVDAYGNFQLCTLLRHPSAVFDLASGSLGKALKEFVPEVRGRIAENMDYLNRCARCHLQPLCEQCPAKSWIENGSLDTPVEYYCEWTHKQAEFLGLISEGQKIWELEKRLSVIGERWYG